jgi:hypothetical protein
MGSDVIIKSVRSDGTMYVRIAITRAEIRLIGSVRGVQRCVQDFCLWVRGQIGLDHRVVRVVEYGRVAEGDGLKKRTRRKRKRKRKRTNSIVELLRRWYARYAETMLHSSSGYEIFATTHVWPHQSSPPELLGLAIMLDIDLMTLADSTLIS